SRSSLPSSQSACPSHSHWCRMHLKVPSGMPHSGWSPAHRVWLCLWHLHSLSSSPSAQSRAPSHSQRTGMHRPEERQRNSSSAGQAGIRLLPSTNRLPTISSGRRIFITG
ncbi:hypothetical protein PENTCL1PPCAC_25852, partial [Pristionchus entomophagus]